MQNLVLRETNLPQSIFHGFFLWAEENLEIPKLDQRIHSRSDDSCPRNSQEFSACLV